MIEHIEREPIQHQPVPILMAKYVAELENQEVKWEKDDPYLAAYCSAALQALEDIPSYREVMEYFVEIRPDLKPSQYQNLAFRSVQKFLLRDRDYNNYPHGYLDKASWLASLADISNPLSPNHDEFIGDITLRNPQANVSRRYRGVSLVLGLFAERFGSEPEILDIGASQNLGLKQMALKEHYPFDPIVGVEWLVKPGHKFGHRPATAASVRRANQFLQQSAPIGPSVGIDIIDPREEGNKEWVRTSSHYPKEWLNDALVEQYDVLDLAEPPGIDLFQGDFSEFNRPEEPGEPTPQERFDRLYPGKKFDVVSFCTVLNQVHPIAAQMMMRHAEQYLKPNGIIVIQDFAKVPARYEHTLVFDEHWFSRNFPYTTIVYDPATSTFHELFLWENSRCDLMTIAPGIGALGLKHSLLPAA